MLLFCFEISINVIKHKKCQIFMKYLHINLILKQFLNWVLYYVKLTFITWRRTNLKLLWESSSFLSVSWNVMAEWKLKSDSVEIFDKMISSKAAIGIAAGVCGTLILGYCIYFDKQRHDDPEFKKKLRESKWGQSCNKRYRCGFMCENR